MDKIAEKLEKILMEHLYRGDLVTSFTENGCCMVCGFPIDRDRIKCGIKPITLAIEKYILDAKKEYFIEVCEFLSKEGYLDDDWWCEQPTALERWEDNLEKK